MWSHNKFSQCHGNINVGISWKQHSCDAFTWKANWWLHRIQTCQKHSSVWNVDDLWSGDTGKCSVDFCSIPKTEQEDILLLVLWRNSHCGHNASVVRPVVSDSCLSLFSTNYWHSLQIWQCPMVCSIHCKCLFASVCNSRQVSALIQIVSQQQAINNNKIRITFRQMRFGRGETSLEFWTSHHSRSFATRHTNILWLIFATDIFADNLNLCFPDVWQFQSLFPVLNGDRQGRQDGLFWRLFSWQ